MNFESSAAQSQSIFSNRSPTSVADYYNPSGRFIFRPENGNSFPENIYLPADEDKDNHRYLSSSSSSVISAPSPSSPSIAPAPPSYENNEIILPEEVTINDVLCGRGRGPANHLGNVRFRQIVGQHRATYLMCKDRKVKAQICNDIVHAVQCSNPPGRFLKQIPSVSTLGGSGDSTKSAWMCIDDVKARMKTGQALREGYTKDTIQRARLLATVAFSGRPMSGTKRNAAEEECNHYPDVETKKSNKRMRITDTPDTMEGVGQQRLPLKKDIMRRVKEDRLRENSLSAWMGSKGCL
mmetsp:Transcript_3728/g.7248  ORF Transcript_3728/g.7248 Transcript_3728/m.7248 type:complete len:295 (-) Transcript_3728:31-915(-)